MSTAITYRCDDKSGCATTTDNSSRPGWISVSVTGNNVEGLYACSYKHYCPEHSPPIVELLGLEFPKPDPTTTTIVLRGQRKW